MLLTAAYSGPRRSACVVVTLVLLVGCASVHTSAPLNVISKSADTWDRYTPVNLNTLKATLFDYPENFVGMTVNAGATAAPYRIEAVYLGETRPMSPVRTSFLRKVWGGAFRIDEAFTSLFETELLFEVEGERYWMPVQSSVIPYVYKELATGDRTDLYVMVVGTIDDEHGHEWIIIVNEFRKKSLPATPASIRTGHEWRLACPYALG